MKDFRFFNNVFFSMGACRPRDLPEAGFETCCLYVQLAYVTSNEHEKKSSDFKFFTRKQLQEFQMRSQLEVETVEACCKEAYAVYIRPKVDAKTLKICGGETLLCWFDRDDTMIPLSLFLPVLNENSYVRYVDQMVFELVYEMIQESIQKGMKIVPISFNLSKASFEDEPSIQEYMEVLQQFDIPKEYIEPELLENMSMDNSDKLIKVMDTIHKAGLRCALDDFGSDCSSMNVLTRVPIDIIKLNRPLLRNPYRDIDNFLIVDGLLDILHRSPVQIVAEGVEDETMAKHMRQHSCDMIQGFYYYRPVPMDEFQRLIAEQGECQPIHSRPFPICTLLACVSFSDNPVWNEKKLYAESISAHTDLFLLSRILRLPHVKEDEALLCRAALQAGIKERRKEYR